MTRFEEVSNEVMGDYDPNNMRENCIYWIQGDQTVTVNFYGNNRYASKIRKLAEEHPDDVKIMSDKDQVVVATVPIKYIKVSPPRQVTDEQRERARETARKYLR